ncbi:MAG TPA: DNA mismatch repair protein MutS [Chitinophagaceae bacterium]|nr:DNA mismatch repair protein MutS [Chitinophagaceae bacterium]HNJ58571.1 DNA mismatch repair protein MutS [Chitinophagaceae bacterium]HNL82337.1 DNA mismatch repair protein MutS [Chitinophagaceae bacterium]HNM34974.1 DNA mismatch repair protein MutS [Chitinophagaceae bacterium]
MIKFFPDTTFDQLEFTKIKNILQGYCTTEYAKNKIADLRVHTRKDFIETALQQTNEFKNLSLQAQYFPNDFSLNLSKEIKLLSIDGATLREEELMHIKLLTNNAANIFRWFDTERKQAYAYLHKIIEGSYYEKNIILLIEAVLDDYGAVKDNASEDLFIIRNKLYRKRNELRRMFEKVLQKLSKAGYSADIEESFSNGRRVVAVFSEHKRKVKGILHGESDTRKTAFIEPEETIELNNEIYLLEGEERKEILKILKTLTVSLKPFAPLIQSYLIIAGEFDFIKAKSKLALSYQGNMPNLTDKAYINIKEAYHPLLYLYNKNNHKKTTPLNLKLDEKNRILIISGPNAGGKTVTMKTIGLLQLMLQSGLLVPVHPTSEMGIFKQIFIHIGDTQSIEFELSTYSSHLLAMKHFIEMANGKTLFFIDELGSGSDPVLGGAFAEVILEELCKKHAMGIVTTHYLNLKVMANHTKGIINGAMAFDEKNLKPMYVLTIGKPGSSYTFAIAQRIGLSPHLISKAKALVDDNHFKLDNLLNNTEKNLHALYVEKKQLQLLLKSNEKLKKEMEQVINKEKHNQQIELLKNQNKISEERIVYLKEMERKLKQIVLDWKKNEDKNEVIKNLNNLLFKKKEQTVVNKLAKKTNQTFKEIQNVLEVGKLVKLKKNYQVGVLKEIRGKRGIVQIGQLPINVELTDLVTVEKIDTNYK